MARPIVVFEDELAHRPFSLILTRPVFDLICGCMSLGEKIVSHLGAAGEKGSRVWWAIKDGDPDVRFHMRAYLAEGRRGTVGTYRGFLPKGDGLTLVNGSLVFSADVLDQIEPDWTGRYVCGETTAVANVPPGLVDRLEEYVGKPVEQSVFSSLPARELKAELIRYPWDLIRLNGPEIARDFALLGGADFKTEPDSMVYLVGRENIRIGENVRIAPGAAIDAARGPVSIEDNVTIMANASLEGPLHIGSGSIVKMGAKIYGETTIGTVCKVGGEIAESIIHGYSNKQHEGFVGHSYIGEWVNLGAGTETSDMKNNYSTVRVRVSGEMVDSGELFVGLFMGDHSKSGIGTVFNTGTLVGSCCNVFGADYPPKHVPSFIWGGGGRFAEYDLDKAIETAGRVMARRNRVLGEVGDAVLRKVFELTAAERRDFLKQ